MGRFNAKSSLALFILSAAVLSGCGGADEGEASQASKRSPLADYRSSSAAKDARRELVGMFTVLNLTAAQAFDQVENNQSAKCDDDAPEQTGGSSPDSPLTWPFSVSVGCS
ncbi:MAG TPA: hypothetical protein PLP17_06895, partial [Oligoflexia bacterium]|nr:hypothetical protein [Oligoflexia bacterium]